MGCIHDLRRNRCCQFLVFFIILAIDLADMINDWLLYHDMSVQKQGLVFGPLDSKLLHALLGFSIIGVITFILELVFLGREIFTPDKKPWLDIDYLSAIVIWAEEVPQITLSVIIASCREEGISIFQISKASVVIFGCCFRLLIAIIRYCRRKRRGKYENKKQFKFCSGILMAGLILSLIGSALVFIFSHVLRDGDKILFQEPTDFMKMKQDTSKYYPGVSIFLDGNQIRDDNNQSRVQDEWIKLVDLTDLDNNMKSAQKIKFNKKGNLKMQIQTVLSRESSPLRPKKTECYSLADKWFISNTTQCTDLFDPNEPSSEIVVYFDFIPQSRQFIMGEIKFNTLTDCLDKDASQKQSLMRYFKTKTLNADMFTKFYKSGDLIPIKEAWETGFVGCESSGAESPHLDNNIHVDCINI